METTGFIAVLFGILLINLVLSGDNAVLIAMASRNLPPRQRNLAMFWGSAAAIILRIVLTVIAVLLLKIPFLQFVGGILIVWIAVKLLTQEDEGGDETQAAGNLWEAVKLIVIADLLMSTDNVLAIAGMAKGDYLLLGIGLALSIPIIILGAQLIVVLMKKFPLIIYIGAAILGWTGGEMIMGDPRILEYLEKSLSHQTIGILDKLVPLALTLFVIAWGYLASQRKARLEKVKEGNEIAKNG